MKVVLYCTVRSFGLEMLTFHTKKLLQSLKKVLTYTPAFIAAAAVLCLITLSHVPGR